MTAASAPETMRFISGPVGDEFRFALRRAILVRRPWTMSNVTSVSCSRSFSVMSSALGLVGELDWDFIGSLLASIAEFRKERTGRAFQAGVLVAHNLLPARFCC